MDPNTIIELAKSEYYILTIFDIICNKLKGQTILSLNFKCPIKYINLVLHNKHKLGLSHIEEFDYKNELIVNKAHQILDTNILTNTINFNDHIYYEDNSVINYYFVKIVYKTDKNEALVKEDVIEFINLLDELRVCGYIYYNTKLGLDKQYYQYKYKIKFIKHKFDPYHTFNIGYYYDIYENINNVIPFFAEKTSSITDYLNECRTENKRIYIPNIDDNNMTNNAQLSAKMAFDIINEKYISYTGSKKPSSDEGIYINTYCEIINIKNDKLNLYELFGINNRALHEFYFMVALKKKSEELDSEFMQIYGFIFPHSDTPKINKLYAEAIKCLDDELANNRDFAINYNMGLKRYELKMERGITELNLSPDELASIRADVITKIQ